jgi:ABC-type glycerol-3-phosphate transport system substrate-binding protein
MKKGWILAVVVFALVCLLPSISLFAAGQQEQPAGTSLAGQKIAVLHLTGKHWDTIFNAQLPNFEQETGIKATVDYLDEKAEMPKVRVVLGAKSDEYDVIFFRGNFMPELIRTGGVEALDSYIAKAKASDSQFNYDDLIPAIVNAFIYDGKTWGLPLMGGGTVLFYNKDHFAEAGLSRPPKNLDELEQYAKKLNTKDHAGFTLRGRREAGTNVYPWIFIWKIQGAKRFDNIKGNWFDENWQPQLATPAAITAVERWASLLRNYGPKGVASYGWQECLSDFQQGAVSMWLDDPVFVSSVEDPTLSKVAGKTGYAVVEGPGKLFGAVAPWGFIMNAYSKKKDAAWEFIKWGTGYKTQLGMVKDGYGLPTRKSVLESDAMKAKLSADYLAALVKAMSVADPAYKPLIPQQAEINDLTSIAISKVLTGQGTATEAMNELNEKIVAIMKRDGYIK